MDPWLDAFMKAEVRKGKRETVVSDYIIKILGLDVSADHQKTRWSCEQLCAVVPGAGNLEVGCESRSDAIGDWASWAAVCCAFTSGAGASLTQRSAALSCSAKSYLGRVCVTMVLVDIVCSCSAA